MGIPEPRQILFGYYFDAEASDPEAQQQAGPGPKDTGILQEV